MNALAKPDTNVDLSRYSGAEKAAIVLTPMPPTRIVTTATKRSMLRTVCVLMPLMLAEH